MRRDASHQRSWFLLDLPTENLIHANPLLPVRPDLAARILEAGGVLCEAGFFTGTGSAGYNGQRVEGRVEQGVRSADQVDIVHR